MRRELGMFVALVCMCAGLWLSNPDFLGHSNAINTTRQISMLGIFAIGIGFVIITGGIDLSIGSVIGLTGVLIAKISSSRPAGSAIRSGSAFPSRSARRCSSASCRALLITRLRLQPFIVTLGGMLLLRGVSQTIVEGGTLSLGASPLLKLANGGLLRVAGEPLIPYPLLIFAAVAAVATYVLHFSVFGRYVYAIGGNREAAEYSGINVKRVETLTYVISAGLGGVAGICYAAYIGQMSQQVGVAYELYAIAAAVLGGCSLRGGEGTVLGIVIGSAIMRVIDNGINMFQVPYMDDRGICPHLAPRPELDLHHRRRRDPARRRPRPGRAHAAGGPAHARGHCRRHVHGPNADVIAVLRSRSEVRSGSGYVDSEIGRRRRRPLRFACKLPRGDLCERLSGERRGTPARTFRCPCVSTIGPGGLSADLIRSRSERDRDQRRDRGLKPRSNTAAPASGATRRRRSKGGGASTR